MSKRKRGRASNTAPQPRSEPKPSRKHRILIPALILVVISAAVVATWAIVDSPRMRSKPNILLVTLDTTRSDSLRCYDPNGALTPNMDQLAAEGARFALCNTSTSLTLPAHGSLMTSLYPYETGLRLNGDRPLASSCNTLAEALKSQGYRTEAVIGAFVLNRQFGLAQGFDGYYDFSAEGASEASGAERPGDQVSAQAIKTLETLGAGPFFMWIHFYDPHHPYEAPGANASSTREQYHAEVAFVDAQIGKLRQALKSTGAADNTIFVIVGDHGEGLGDHDEPYHGFYTYQSTLHVPFIMNAPGRIPPGGVFDAAVRTIDIAPTLLDLAGGPAPQEWRGVSLRSLIQGKGSDLDLDSYGEAVEGYFQFGLAPLRSLMSGGWKYILAPEPELYHVAEDPMETRNLIDSRQQRATELREQMRSLIANSADPPSAEAEVSELDPESRAKIESLGYVGVGHSDDGMVREIDRFEPAGKNPKYYMDAFLRYSDAVRMIRSGQLQDGERLLRTIMEQIPEAPRVRADLAYSLQMQRRFDEARVLYQEAMALAPTHVHLRKMFAGMLQMSGNWAELAEVAGEVIEQDPSDANMWFDVGVALAMLDRLEEARPHFEMAYKLAPYNVRYVHGMGQLCLREGDAKRATEFYREALGINPNHRPSQVGLEKATRALNGNSVP